MNDTIFSKIIKREIPADIVYENEDVLAFLDISPASKGATLVVPKKWSRNILDIDSTTLCKMMEAVRTLAPAIQKAMNAEGITILMNNEPAGNQMIFHSHIHILPRHNNDEVMNIHGTPYPEGEKELVAEKIRATLTK